MFSLPIQSLADNVLTVEGGKLVPLKGPFADGGSLQEAIAFHKTHEMMFGARANDAARRFAQDAGVRGGEIWQSAAAGHVGGAFPAIGGERSYRAGDAGGVYGRVGELQVPSRSHLLAHYAIDAIETRIRRELGGDGVANDAWSANLNGAPFLDLISRIRETAEMPRPETIWTRAFPDMIPFTVGAMSVPADVILWSGKAMIGHKGSLSDIPEMTFGSATTEYKTAWVILSVTSGYQDMARASNAPGTILTLDQKAERALGEVDLAIDGARWNGATGAGIVGLTGNPFVARYRDLDIDLATSSAADIIAAFSFLGNYVRRVSGGAAQVDTALFAPSIEEALNRSISTSDSTLIITRVIEILARYGIKVETIPEGWRHLESLSTNVHGVAFYNRTRREKAPRALIGQEPTVYMDTSNPLNGRAYVIAQFGDIHHTGESFLLGEFYKS